jgi:hypothetical protein
MPLLRELEKYIHQVLGEKANAVAWAEEKTLPFFLRDRYDFFLLHIRNQHFLLMVDLQQETSPPSVIRKHMEQLRRAVQDDIIYVRAQVTSYNRNRLVKNKIPFIVPGNQLYLPMLGMDLREYFMRKQVEVKKLSPAAQVLVLHSIYKQRALFNESMTMTDWAQELGYTKMTMARAFRELRSILEENECSEEIIRGRPLWDRLRPFLRTPIMRRRYYDVGLSSMPQGALIGGDGALAHYTQMAEPHQMTVCMSGQNWKKFQEDYKHREISRPEPRCLIVEIWRYVPQCLATNKIADPLSVYLSYEKNMDERVEMALDELLEGVGW